ncbi:MAG: hypothetical protein WAT36_09055 [Chromatiaceae bacterium]
MPPFTTPYLTLVCPHPEWGTNAGDYASDCLSAQRLNSRGKPVAGLPAEAKLEDARRLAAPADPKTRRDEEAAVFKQAAAHVLALTEEQLAALLQNGQFREGDQDG